MIFGLNGWFRNEGDGVDLITDFYANDVQFTAKAGLKYERQTICIPNDIVGDWQQQVTRMIFNDVLYRIYDGYVQLENYLIYYINDTSDKEEIDDV